MPPPSTHTHTHTHTQYTEVYVKKEFECNKRNKQATEQRKDGQCEERGNGSSKGYDTKSLSPRQTLNGDSTVHAQQLIQTQCTSLPSTKHLWKNKTVNKNNVQ
jgi:hypothetical protein